MNSISNSLIEDIRVLSETIGTRPSGSRAGWEAAGFLQRSFEAAGLQTDLQDFPAVGWTLDGCSLQVGSRSLAAQASPFSPACDLQAGFVTAGTLEELSRAETRGKIAVLHGALTASWIPSRYAVYISEVPEVIRLLEEKQPAVLTVSPNPDVVSPVIVDWSIDFPSAVVPPQAGMALLAARGEALRLVIDSQRTPGKAANVTAFKPGRRSERILLCAHYDTHFGSPGAMDNASGVAVLLGLARWLAGKELDAGVELVAMAGEENHGVGNAEYMRRCGDQLDRLMAVVNVDGVGHALGTNTATLLGGSAELRTLIDETLAAFPGMAWVEPWYESDHSSFAMRGVPAVAVSSSGFIQVTHTARDTLEWISPEKIGEALNFVSRVIAGLHTCSAKWCRAG